MKDPEFILLRNRFLIGLIVIILFFVPLGIFLKNKLIIKDSIIIEIINKEENALILVTKEKCDSCKNIEKKLKEEKVSYQILNVNKDKNYDRILKKLNLSSEDILPPTIVYLENGKLHASLVEKDLDDLDGFLEVYNLKRFEG